jgi:hypothetical protein
VRGRVVRAGGDGAGLGHTPDCRKNGPGLITRHAGFATPFTTITGRRPPVRGSASDRVVNPSILDRLDTVTVGLHRERRARPVSKGPREPVGASCCCR